MAVPYTEKLEDTQKELSSYFDKSAAIVRSNFDWFEKAYAKPAIQFSLASFDAHPFVSTFFAMFAFLSLLPMISFIGFSFFLISSIAFVACALAIVTIAVVEFFLLIILLTTLTIMLILALFLTPVALFTYAIGRLILYVRLEGSAGIPKWVNETKSHFVTTLNRVRVSEESEGSEVSTGSGSVVVVEAAREVKVEG